MKIVFVLAAFVVGFIRLAELAYDNAVNLPFEDQWDFLRPLFEDRGPFACFLRQHGPHREGIGGFIDWYLYRATSWDVRAEAWFAVVVLASAALVAIRLSVQLRGRLAWSDAGFALLLLSPVHWETMLLTPNVAHSILPLLLVFCLARSWLVESAGRRLVAVGAASTLCLFTGFGLCAAVISLGLALLLLLRPPQGRGESSQVAGWFLVTIIAAGFAAFAINYHWEPAVPGWKFPVPRWWDYGRFMGLMYTSLLGWRSITIASAAVGCALLVLVCAAFIGSAAAIWRRDADNRTYVVWILTGTSLVYGGLTAIGRLPVNIEAAFMWRYTTLMLPGLCGLYLAAESWIASRPVIAMRSAHVAWMGICALIWLNFLPDRNAATTAEAKAQWIASYRRSHDLATANRESEFWVYFPEPVSPVIAARLKWLEAHHLSFFRPSKD